MKFYTKKSKQIFCAFSVALGVAIIAGAIAFLVSGSIFKSEAPNTSFAYEGLEQVVGEPPNAADYEGGYLNEAYKIELEEYDLKREAEAENRKQIIKAEQSVIFRKKLLITGIVALIAAIPAAIFAYFTTVSVLEIKGGKVLYKW